MEFSRRRSPNEEDEWYPLLNYYFRTFPFISCKTLRSKTVTFIGWRLLGIWPGADLPKSLELHLNAGPGEFLSSSIITLSNYQLGTSF